MASKTPAEVFAIIAPEFAQVDPAQITGALELADSRINTNMREDVRVQAVAYLAAHILTCARRKLGASGEVVNISEGDLSIAYNVGSNDPLLGNTIYGKQVEVLINSYFSGIRTGIINDYH